MKLHELVETEQKYDIKIVCGYPASGKGTYSREKFPDYYHATCSKFVRALSGFKTRSDLATTAHLDHEIFEEICKEIEEHPKICIDGIRQPQIIKALVKKYKIPKENVIWLDVSMDALKHRFYDRDAKKDDMSWEETMKSDKDLGIDGVKDFIEKHGTFVPF